MRPARASASSSLGLQLTPGKGGSQAFERDRQTDRASMAEAIDDGARRLRHGHGHAVDEMPTDAFDQIRRLEAHDTQARHGGFRCPSALGDADPDSRLHLCGEAMKLQRGREANDAPRHLGGRHGQRMPRIHIGIRQTVQSTRGPFDATVRDETRKRFGGNPGRRETTKPDHGGAPQKRQRTITL